MELHKIYTPMTATPFRCNETYVEYMPCKALQPYVKCFWGSQGCYRQVKESLAEPDFITPDTCVDIIFDIDVTNSRIQGCFSGINDRAFFTELIVEKGRMVSCFAIRFYAWSAVLFSEESLCGSKNSFYTIDQYFPQLRKAIEPLLFDVVALEERVRLAEMFLLKHIHLDRVRPVVMEAIKRMVLSRGTVSVGQIAKDCSISSRQLERLFGENIGTTPKTFSSLVRYQCLWQEMVYNSHFSVLDAVYRYGYSDQAHLLHDFKKFHGLNMKEARQYAWEHMGR